MVGCLNFDITHLSDPSNSAQFLANLSEALPVFDKIFILPLDRNAPEQIYLCTNRYIFYVFSMTLKCTSEVICHLRHQDTCLLRQISTNTDTVDAAGLGQSPCYVMK